MAEQRETVILDVQLDAAKVSEDLNEVVTRIAALKDKQAELTKEIKDGNDVNGEYAKQLIQVKDQLSWCQKQAKGLSATQKLLNADTMTYADTLNGERQKLADMQKAYDQLDASMRDSEGGKVFLKALHEQSDLVKTLEAETGRAQRNVGNYAEAFKAAGVSVGGFGAKMKALFANPWAILIAAIVAAVKKLVDAFKSSENRMRELQTAFAPLRGAIDVVKQLFDDFAKVLSNVVVFALDRVSKGVQWLAKQLDKLGQLFGQEWGLSEQLEKAQQNTNKLAKAEQDYLDHKRKFVVEEAKMQRDIAQLRDQAADKENYTAQQRLEFLQKAAAIEGTLAAERKKLAIENLNILKMKAAESENDAALNNELAEAEAEVIRVEAELANNRRALTKGITAATREVNAEMAAMVTELEKADEAARKAKEELDKLLSTRPEEDDDLASATAKYTALLAKKKQLEAQYQKESLETQRTNELNAVDELVNAHVLGAETAGQLKVEINQKYNDIIAEQESEALAQRGEELEFWGQTVLSTISSINDAISAGERRQLAEFKKGNAEKKTELERRLKSGIISEQEYDQQMAAIDEEEHKREVTMQREQAKREKALGIMNATISTAAAIIGFLANPGGIPGIALSVAAGITGAAQIAAIAAEPLPQFATGTALVGGGKYSDGDTQLARLSPEEMVLNPTQYTNLARGLFDYANNPRELGGGLDYELLGATMAAAVAEQPAPVMVYDEFKQFGDKVSTYNEITRL